MLTELSPAPAKNLLRDVYIARQPIFDRRLEVYGYEVLFRNSAENRAIITDGNQATSELLLNAFVEIGLDRVVGDRLAFVNFPRDFLLGPYPMPLMQGRLVLEILEDVEIDDELVCGVRRLIAEGWTLAVDDAVFQPRLIPLFELAHIVKVELPSLSETELPVHVEKLRHYPAKLLAEKIEDAAKFEMCRELGFDLFQGYFLSRPQMMQGQGSATNHLTVLQLLARLRDPRVSVSDLESLIERDVTLTYKLLRFINSSRFCLRHRVESIRQAILMVGLDGIRTLTMLVSLADKSRKPNEVLVNAIQRAFMCEKLGRKLEAADPDAYFTVGLLSSLEVILQVPMGEIVKSLPLGQEIERALLNREGILGAVLQCVLAHETSAGPIPKPGNLLPEEIRETFLSSIAEARQAWESMIE